MDLICREFDFGSQDYKLSLDLRETVLLKPLGLSWEPGIFEGEEYSFHLGGFMDEKLVGTLVLKPLNETTVKMRQVAVASEAQGKGIGSALAMFAEQLARSAGYQLITAHARAAAVPFYRKLGYAVGADAFLEVSIPHYVISKSL